MKNIDLLCIMFCWGCFWILPADKFVTNGNLCVSVTSLYIKKDTTLKP